MSKPSVCKVIEPEDFREELFEGTVILDKFEDGFGYGFIQPADGDGKFSSNVWFGEMASQGEDFELGDVVLFAYSNKFVERNNKPRAFRVWPKIKMLAGEK
jgi:'Cold-shock' DNA-binding domain